MSVRRRVLSAVVVAVLPLCVTARSTVYVTGSVNKPGLYEFDEPFTAGDAMKVAGGFRDRTTSMCLTVLRKDGDKPVRLKAVLDTPIHHDDRLQVQPVNDGQRLDIPCPER